MAQAAGKVDKPLKKNSSHWYYSTSKIQEANNWLNVMESHLFFGVAGHIIIYLYFATNSSHEVGIIDSITACVFCHGNPFIMGIKV